MKGSDCTEDFLSSIKLLPIIPNELVKRNIAQDVENSFITPQAPSTRKYNLDFSCFMRIGFPDEELQ